jgi:hypothetical protein
MVRDRGRPGCAAESLDRDEPLIATASRVRRWLLIEQPGPWGREALVESRLALPLAHTVRSHARRTGVRVVLVRRPGWRGPATAARRVFLVRSDRVHRWTEQLDVEEPEELIRLDLTALDSDDPPGVGAPGPPALHLVCTNGRHDPCCADLGRPVVRALADAETPEVWESSHIGGDRFAANLVSLPGGIYYGRVSADDAPRLVRELDEGVIDLDCYRGRSCYPPLVQAAEIFARRHLGERRVDGLRILSAVAHGHELTAHVEQTGEPPTAVEVHVSQHQGQEEHLTCSDHGTSHPWTYRLDEITVV